MLAITKIYNNKGNCFGSLAVNVYNNTFFNLNTVLYYCDIIDLVTNEKNTKILVEDLLNTNYSSIIGIINGYSTVKVNSIGSATINLLKCITEVKFFDFQVDFYEFLNHYYPNNTYLCSEGFSIFYQSKLHKFQTNKGVVYAVYMPDVLKKLDDFGVFWMYGSVNIDLLYLYEAFLNFDLSDCKAIFFMDKECHLLQLQINNKVRNFLIKRTILRNKNVSYN